MEETIKKRPTEKRSILEKRMARQEEKLLSMGCTQEDLDKFRTSVQKGDKFNEKGIYKCANEDKIRTSAQTGMRSLFQ